jgi:prevent-host-death family protein
MPKTVSASEAKNRLGALIKWSQDNQDEVIIENRGVRTVALVPYEAYEQLLAFREQIRRQKALEQLEKLKEQVQARNQDLTETQAAELGDRLTREVIEEMADEGQVRFQKS